mgnify:FL=1
MAVIQWVHVGTQAIQMPVECLLESEPRQVLRLAVPKPLAAVGQHRRVRVVTPEHLQLGLKARHRRLLNRDGVTCPHRAVPLEAR